MRLCRRFIPGLLLASLLVALALPLFLSTTNVFADGLVISTTLAPEAYENEDYSWQLPVSGGTAPYSCNVTGILPSWLVLSQATLTISGKPPRGLATDNTSFAVKIADSSNPPVVLDARINIPQRYHSNISVGAGVTDNQTTIYVDGQPADKVSAGNKVIKTFISGSKHVISVDSQIFGSGNNVKYSVVNDKVAVSGLSPDAAFDYSAEYNLKVKTNVAEMPPLSGSGWYKAGTVVETTALSQYDAKPGVQYRFSFWQLPTGEVSGNPALELKVAKQGEVVATYDIYYQLTFNTPYCSVNGGGWYKAGSSAKWNMACAETIPSPDFWGSVGVELKPSKSAGTVIMDRPQEIDITWKPDYTKLVVAVTLGAIGAIATIVITIAHEKIKGLMSRMRGGGY
jgi:hypothetical protein